MNYIPGRVSDMTSGKAVEADVQLYRPGLPANWPQRPTAIPRAGEFLVCLPTGRDYALNASAEGYLFFSENYSIAQRHGGQALHRSTCN